MCSRVKSAKATDDFDVEVPSEIQTIVDFATANIGHEVRGVKCRCAGADGAKTRVKSWTDASDKLPSSKLHRLLKGTSSHLDYRYILKLEASVAASRFNVAQDFVVVGKSTSIDAAVKGMRIALAVRGVEIGNTTC